MLSILQSAVDSDTDGFLLSNYLFAHWLNGVFASLSVFALKESPFPES